MKMNPDNHHRPFRLLLAAGLGLSCCAAADKDTFLEKDPKKPAAEAGTGKKPFETPPAEPKQETKEAVQVTELGLMRTLVVFDKNVDASLVKIVNQALTERDLRVFEAAATLREGKADKDTLKSMGEKSLADLVLHVGVSAREKKKFGNFSLYEGEATVEIVSPVSGELLVTHTTRADGERNTDAKVAERSATEKAMAATVTEAVTKALEKSDKIIVYEVEISNVPNNLHILRIKDHIAKLKGVYHVRDLSYDPGKKLALLEVLGSPKMLTFLKAHIESMPKMPAKEEKK